MSLLNFFRRKKNQITDQSTTIDKAGINKTDGAAADPNVATDLAEPIPVDYDLFVDNQAPRIKETPKQPVGSIEKYLSQNFQQDGYTEGYDFPQTEYLQNKIKLIKADFRLLVDLAIDNKKAELYELKLHLIKVEGISQRLESQINEKIAFVEADIRQLEKQKVLSIDDEGIIASSLHAYRLGFIEGVEKYQSEKLFAGSTGLFN